MFRKDFVWGAATAAAQIEGAYNQGGRSPSIWDSAADISGKVQNGDTNHTACNHYNLYKQDVGLMKEIGLKAYRFSISWSRLIPSGTGEVSAQGLEFYNNLIDELLKNGIEPYITLYHWDMPQVLQDKGGWLNKESPQWYEYYAKQVALLFGDRVKFFFTFNEFGVFIDEGYLIGTHAPFYQLPCETVFTAAHNALLANGLGTIALRQFARKGIQVGQAHCLPARMPASNRAEDIAAAKKKLFDEDGRHFWDTWFIEAINKGKYIESRLKNLNVKFNQSDMRVINQQPDFIGFNTYFGEYYKADENGNAARVNFDPDINYSAMNWPIAPDCVYYMAKNLHERYNKPLLLSENGIALSEIPNAKGEINDESRIEYIRAHLKALDKAVVEGADVRGYFYWSLMDNFEWAHGNSKRFGLIRVNYNTFERTIKQSGKWYSQIIKSNGESL